jgi:hypothetical protein
MDFELSGLAPDERKRYSVRVLIDLDGDGAISRGDYISTTDHPVLTGGHPWNVVINVERVG